jgi:hypothetical protein
MPKIIAIAVSAAAMLVCLPAYAQESELEGAPGYRAAEQEAAKKAEAQKKAVQAGQKPAQQQAQKPAQQQVQKQAQSAADKLKAEQAKLAQQAEAQKAEQARLAKLAEDLKAEQARLDARAAELAEEKRRLLQERVDKASEAAKLAALDRPREPAEQDEVPSNKVSASEELPNEGPGDRLPSISPEPRRPAYARLDYAGAERSCIRAAEDEALDRDFYSARYDAAPRFYQNDGWELRGRVRLEDRRGYLLVNMVCEIGPNSEAMDVIFLR